MGVLSPTIVSIRNALCICLACLVPAILVACGASGDEPSGSCSGPAATVSESDVAADEVMTITVQFEPCVDGADVYDDGRVEPFTSAPITDVGVVFEQGERSEELVRRDPDATGLFEAEVRIPAWAEPGEAVLQVDGAEPSRIEVATG